MNAHRMRMVAVFGAVVFILSLAAALAAFSVWANGQNTRAARAACVLETLVRLDVGQINGAIRSGEYAHLEKIGVLSLHDLDRINQELAVLEQAQQSLAGSCS